jgi:Regulator of ribonuclease activity B
MRKAASTLLLAMVVSCAVQPPALTPEQRADAEVIENLKRAGSDLSKPHATEFYLYFARESSAREASIELRDAGYQLHRIGASSKAGEWVVIAGRNIVPTLAEITRLTSELNRLARTHKGVYDGWEAAVTK